MAINERPLVSGKIRYEARLAGYKDRGSRTRRFDTLEEAQNQIRDWKTIDARRVVKPSGIDFKTVQNYFLYGRR